MQIETKLSELGLTLPTPATAVANYVPVLRTGDLIFVSGQLPMCDGAVTCEGKVDADVTEDHGYEAARLCAINAIAQLKAEAGDLDLIARIVRIEGFVSSSPGWTGQPKVINGASDLFVEVFGDAGRHTRIAVGAAELPLNAAVEVAVTAQLKT